ncbi:tetratricopeptide repeat protein [Sulfuritalea sp.]|uniref:nuclear transport factor 2 family protein n=1 Tax=Sulfuritalea sp. TaxID=2480090 RepID=UPI00286E6659|nr:tetratricopeptide repeat protein [Sulfuritalea sp.]
MTQFRLNAARLMASAASVVLLAVAPAVHADALQDISKQIKQGQHAQALEQVDKYLAGKPKDAQGRFLKGIVLAEMNKPNEAIVVFTKLTEDYPELPEPYNNLAVIYAQQKQYDKAKQALEMAIRTHPSYATAHENLGDIYARLASQAYDKALQIDSSNPSAQKKLALIRDLMGTAGRPGKTTKPIGDARPAEPVKLVEAPKPPAPVAAAPVAAAPVATPPAAAPAAAPAKPAAEKPAADANADIARAIDLWAAAWSRKDTKAYLATYARDFKTPAGESRAAWESERQKRIAKPGAIQVSVENLRVSVDGDTATAKFRQHYKSATLKTSSNKVLLLGKRDGKWQIVQERVGS